MNTLPYLSDADFLKALDLEKHKTQFVRIIVLDFNTELPIASIEGKSTGGSCTFNGASSARRAGNCSLLVDKQGLKRIGYADYEQYGDITNVQNLISMGKKIRLETGFVNTLINKYPDYANYDIIWFPLGTYVIKTASISKNNSGVNISLSLNDKSALLNGEIGGTFPAGVKLSEVEEYVTNKDGSIQRISRKLLIKDMIRYIVTEFGGEDPSNILITDIPDTIVKVMKWIGDDPLYHLQDITEKGVGNYFLLNEIVGLETKATYNYGQDVCYLNEPFVYPGDLESSAGESVASALDKIKNTLGNYEWFYDVNGKFVFQEIKNYLNTSLSTSLLNLSEDDYRVTPNLTASVYTFNQAESTLFTSISNNPQYQNIKNDFVVWGTMKTASGADKPIRYRVVLGTKPPVDSNKKWPALVYTDYRNLKSVIMLKEGVNYEVFTDLTEVNMTNRSKYYLYINGSTIKTYCWFDDIQDFAADINYEICYLKIPVGDWRTQLYFEGLSASKQIFAQYPYAAELNSEWPKIYNVQKTESGNQNFNGVSIPVYTGGFINGENTSAYEYWLDILEGSQFSVENIGRRQKVVTEKDVNCLFPVNVPNFILIEADGSVSEERALAESKQQEVIQVSSKVFNNLALGGGYFSAFDKIKDLLYTHTSYNESISLSIMPIYYLEPNTRITVYDSDTLINGDYMIKSISLPLVYNGTGTISATKITEKTF